MITYIFALVFLVHGAGMHGMDNESKSKKLEALRAMGADNKAANRNMLTRTPVNDPDEDRRLILDRLHYELEKQKKEYERFFAERNGELQRRIDEHQELQARIAQRNEKQINRLIDVVGRQTDTISHLNGLIQGILKLHNKSDSRIAEHDLSIIEIKQFASGHINNLVNAVGNQTDLISRQTDVIRQLINQMNEQDTVIDEQKKILRRHAIKLQEHDQMHDTKRKMILAIIRQLDDQAIDKIMKFCEVEFNKPEMPVVESSDESDSELKRQVFGSDSPVSLGDDPEEIAQFNVRLVKQEKIEDLPPADDEKLNADVPAAEGNKLTESGWEVVEEYEEEILPKGKEEVDGRE